MTTALRLVDPGSIPASAAYMSPSRAPQLRWPVKQPDDVLDYAIEVGTFLRDVNDDLATISLSASPSGAGELTPVSVSASGSRITGWISGGVPGRVYIVRVEATTIGGRTIEWLMGLQVSPILGSSPAAPPSAGFGTPVTWAYAAGFDFSQALNSGYLPFLAGF